LFAWILPLTFAVITVVVDRLKDVVPGEYRPGQTPSFIHPFLCRFFLSLLF
jgi:hypothetical protein